MVSRIFMRIMFSVSLLLACIVVGAGEASTQTIKVQGRITCVAEGKALPNVFVSRNGAVLGVSDMEGRYVVDIPVQSRLVFSLSGYDDACVEVGDRQLVDITLKEKVVKIEEVLVTGKLTEYKVIAEPADIDVVGDYLHVRTRFRVAKGIFNSDKRFVVQTVISNKTRQADVLLAPVVIDGRNYAITQERMFGFAKEQDKLKDYIVKNTLDQTDYVYLYHDSVRVRRDELGDYYQANCQLAIAGYHTGDLYLDSVVIARGTRNLLRLFDFSAALRPQALMDSAYYPKPELKVMEESGSSKIAFLIGKARIDKSSPANREELDKIVSVLRNVQSDSYSTLSSIEITGYSSPDVGLNAEKNEILAKGRAKLILDIVTDNINSTLLGHVRLTSRAVVEPWQKVIDRMENDHLPLAGDVRRIVERHLSPLNRQWAMMKLPEYKKVIEPLYLEPLRRVEYRINYTYLRHQTDEEIKARFDTKGERLSRYEYFRLIHSAWEEAGRSRFEERALAEHPDFLWVANLKAIRLLEAGSVDLNVLEPFINRQAPKAVLYNQTAMALMDNNVELADSLINLLKDCTGLEKLKGVAALIRGHYREAYSALSGDGGINEVLLLLCLAQEEKAYTKITGLVDLPENAKNARMWYVRAICERRLDNLVWALESMRRAIQLDPTLEKMAWLDSDVMELMNIIKPEGE